MGRISIGVSGQPTGFFGTGWKTISCLVHAPHNGTASVKIYGDASIQWPPPLPAQAKGSKTTVVNTGANWYWTLFNGHSTRDGQFIIYLCVRFAEHCAFSDACGPQREIINNNYWTFHKPVFFFYSKTRFVCLTYGVMRNLWLNYSVLQTVNSSLNY